VGEFGEKFRKAREKKDLSLDDVSNVTKISTRNLQAIEEEHFDQLPGGVFNKGFIRAYAKHVGLDGDQAVNEYLACLRQAQIDAQAVWEPENRAAVAEKRPIVAAQYSIGSKNTSKSAEVKKPVSTQIEELPELQLPRPDDVRPPRRAYPQSRENRLPWRIALGTVLVLMLGAALWQRHTRGARAEGSPPHPAAPVSVPTADSSSAPPTLPATTQATPPSSLPKPNSAPNSSPEKTASATASSKPVVNSPSNPPQETKDVTVRSSSEAIHTTPPPAAPTLSLVIRADENSWISVTADGQLVSQETLIAPAHTSVHANREIVAKVGNAGGVTFLWNGQEIPAQGNESEVKTFVFDASGMKALPTTPNE
jgi:cytoskeleton protein RodZ